MNNIGHRGANDDVDKVIRCSIIPNHVSLRSIMDIFAGVESRVWILALLCRSAVSA
jgi:hypothetical protein